MLDLIALGTVMAAFLVVAASPGPATIALATVAWGPVADTACCLARAFPLGWPFGG
ncbi:hypothetical protein [Actibacterium sp. 188UL27-1]|uniref:hypothetical protein n=1 Tax=Actibacterium sp. 188UL27-1 TaxID=2786961 RepID=UPI0019585102|nr:hypothetical protein [Actibacterium sp. 188UL27-1]MBM7068008.1 hypothetical protein [Actibacterium sp. 188UL27-1]